MLTYRSLQGARAFAMAAVMVITLMAGADVGGADVGGADVGGADEFTPQGVPLTSRGFEKIDEEYGVSVFKHPGAEIVRVAAEALLHVSPADLLEVLLDYEGQKGVVDRISSSQVLSRQPNRLVVYQRLNLPVIDDRDYILSVTWGRKGNSYWVRYEVTSAFAQPEVDGVVRVPYHSGSWQLQPAKGGAATRARFQASIDLAGWLPKWLAKSGAGDELPGVFKNLCTLVDRDRKGGMACL